MSSLSSGVLDSSAAISFMRGRFEAEEAFRQFDHLLLPIVALGELYPGFERAANPARELRKLEWLVSQCDVLAPDSSTAREYARIKAELFAVGRPIPDNDVWIAAEARLLGLPLLANDAHFSLISRLQTVPV